MGNYALKQSKLHGIGLFADQAPINGGDKILLEAPLLQMSTSEDAASKSIEIGKFCDQLQKLSRKEMNRLRLIAFKNGYISDQSEENFAEGLQNRGSEAQEAAMAVFFHKSIYISTCSRDQLLGIFDEMDLINHSCIPNAEQYWNEVERKMELRATIKIERDNEILISYVNPFQAREKRHSDLGFECKCPPCSLHGFELSTFEQRIEILQKAFAILRAFQMQYFHNTEFEKASEGLIAAIAADPRADDVLIAAKNTIEIVANKFRCNILKLVKSYRVIYIILACRAKFRDNNGKSYESACQWKVCELAALALCRGLKYQTARDVLRQLLDHAVQCLQFGHDDLVVLLRKVLERCNCSLERINVGQRRVQLKALIRDGPDDVEEEIQSTLGYDMA